MKNNNKRRKRRWILLGILLTLVLIVTVSALRGRYDLTVSHYTLSSEKLTDSFRVVQLSDLHNREFGEGNEQLLEEVARQKPDLIFITGDSVIRYLPEREVALALMERLTEIAPVYVSMGNHEDEYDWRFGTDLYDLYSQTGVTVLEKEYVDIQVNGQELRIGGVYGYCLPEEYLRIEEYRSTWKANEWEVEFLRGFLDTERYTLLLCHRPVAWIENGSLEAWPVDCVYAGHAHGGQVRLPFIGGLVAPDQGILPGRVAGEYTSEDGNSTLILSRGLGSSAPVPRIFNVPEIVVTDFVPTGAGADENGK